MKRLLVVSVDRDLTSRVAETLMVPESTDPDQWDVARAHSGLEAFVLLDRGGRPFDALVVDTPLPDQNAVALLNRVRRSAAGQALPVYVLADRPDRPLRRLVDDTDGMVQLIDKPLSAQTLRRLVDGLRDPLRVLLAEPDGPARERFHALLNRAGYVVETHEVGREAVERQPRLRPQAVIANLHLADITGLVLCEHVRRAAVLPAAKVILYGSMAAFSAHRTPANEPDDFLPTPFDDDLLVDRLGALIGQADGHRPRRRNRLRDWRRASTPGRPRRPPTPATVHVEVRADGRQFSVEEFEMSPAGLFLTVEDKLSIGDEVDLRVELADGRGPIQCSAGVAWVNATPPNRGIGLRLKTLDPGGLERLQTHGNRGSQ